MMLSNREGPELFSFGAKFAGKTRRGTFSGGVSVPLTSSAGGGWLTAAVTL